MEDKQCALPAGGNVLCILLYRTAHGSRGETSLWDVRPAAMCSGISQAHSPQYAMCHSSVHFRTIPYPSVPAFALLRRGKPTPQQRGGAVISQRHDAAHSIGIAHCAMHMVKALHMEHGGKPYFSPRVPPFRPCVIGRPAARDTHSLSYRARPIACGSGAA